MKPQDQFLSLEAFQMAVTHLGGGSGAEVHAQLCKAWMDASRSYHTLQHLGECLTHAHAWGAKLQQAERAQLELALWFHDAVYDTHSSDNERLSASWARSALAQLGVPPVDCERLEQLVIATEHSSPVPVGDYLTDLLLDIDLAILGAPWARFCEYEAQIREEYGWVGEAEYAVGRGRVLDRFRRAASDEPPSLYRTDAGRTLLARARANLGASAS